MIFLQGPLSNLLKSFSLIIGLCLLFCLAGCGSDETPQQTGTATPSPTSAVDETASADQLKAREAELESSMAKSPADLGLANELASVRADLAVDAYARGEEARAFDLLSNSLAIDPLQPDRWELFGDWALASKISNNDGLAYLAYRQALDLSPGLPRIEVKLSALSAGRRNWDEALQRMEQGLASPRAEVPEWNQLTLLVQLYIRAGKTPRGMAYLHSRYESTIDDRYLLALAALMDANGQGDAAAQIAATVADRKIIPAALKLYAERLARRFADAGDKRLYGEQGAAQSWRGTP